MCPHFAGERQVRQDIAAHPRGRKPHDYNRSFKGTQKKSSARAIKSKCDAKFNKSPALMLVANGASGLLLLASSSVEGDDLTHTHIYLLMPYRKLMRLFSYIVGRRFARVVSPRQNEAAVHGDNIQRLQSHHNGHHRGGKPSGCPRAQHHAGLHLVHK
jgi:hypothetical protein